MKRNPLKFLGLLGLLGLVGIFTGNYGFYGFFGFFGFFGLKEKADEMLWNNQARAGLNAFVVSLVGVAFVIAVAAYTQSLMVAAVALAVLFIAQVATFVFSFNIYESKGDTQ